MNRDLKKLYKDLKKVRADIVKAGEDTLDELRRKERQIMDWVKTNGGDPNKQ